MTIKKKNPFSTAGQAFTSGIAAAALSLCIIPDPANGTDITASETVEIRAEIPKLCKFDSSFNSSLVLPLHNGKPAGELSKVTSDANITCNTAANVELVSQYGGILHSGVHIQNNESALAGNQMTSFDYIASLTHSSGVLVNLDTDDGSIGSTETSSPVAAFDSNSIPSGSSVTLEIQPETVMGVLQSGTYVDNLTVKVIPQ